MPGPLSRLQVAEFLSSGRCSVGHFVFDVQRNCAVFASSEFRGRSDARIGSSFAKCRCVAVARAALKSSRLHPCNLITDHRHTHIHRCIEYRVTLTNLNWLHTLVLSRSPTEMVEKEKDHFVRQSCAIFQKETDF